MEKSEEDQSKRVTVRISHSLNEGEKNHVTSRRKTAQKCLERHGIPCSLDQLPNIALLGSGGSERALVGLLGSLVALSQDDLLDSMLYLAGISGSTWCMTSLYKEPDWSSKMEKMKDDIKEKLLGCVVSFRDKISKLRKYYRQKDNFSLTDVWAVLFISRIKKEIDERTLSELRSKLSTRDPYPIYTTIDMQSKKHKLKADTFVEITPHEAGYSITGAFVESSSFGSQFDQGLQIKDQPEMDMQFLQGLCGSGVADPKKVLMELLTFIKSIIWGETDMMGKNASSDLKQTDVGFFNAQHVDKAGQVLLNLVELNLLVLREEDPSSHIKALNELLREKLDEETYKKLTNFDMTTKDVAKKNVKEYTLYVCEHQSDWDPTCNGTWRAIIRCIELVIHWIWGTTYNFLYNMRVEEVPCSILKDKKRPYADAGIINNSPYLPVLRKERNIDLIISLDFSEDDPFESVKKTYKTCKELHIDFPEIPDMPEKEKADPKDFYVFEGENVPTVIHIPLFNKVNCGNKDEIKKWKMTYRTLQGAYSSDEMIDDLLNKAGMNIKNNKENLLTEIQKVIKRKTPHFCSIF